ncbi:competence protein [Sorangium cellulosum]|uniref:Competence protein n=1 Tax=Sorangium cellulosum TaxID=56 RepID=A0A4P2QBU0_SORCE|nr:DNA internalization-related competence protein ComEC/Rec2 [Sorangium cellulosum]AUX27089.1 competence protein [Sorangium cellulosum]
MAAPGGARLATGRNAEVTRAARVLRGGAAVVDPVLLLGLALAAGAPLALAPAPTALGAALVAAALRRHVGGLALAAAGVALVASGLRARALLDRAGDLYDGATALLQPPARCEVTGAVVSSPVVVGTAARRSSGGARAPEAAEDEGEPATARVDVEISGGTCGGRAIAGSLRARLYGAPMDLARGDRLDVVVDLAPLHLFRNEGLRDATAAIARSGVVASGTIVDARRTAEGRSIGAAVDRARASVRERIEATFHPDATALGRALVLGETDLAPEDQAAFRESGLAHLLAVSGTHLVLAVAGFAAALRAILVRVGPIAARWDAGRITAALCVPAAWLYADFAGGGGSATRAAAMLSFAMGARLLGLRPVGVRSFALSLAGAGAFDPLVACDLSFGLSAAATAGLLWLQRPLAAALVPGPGEGGEDRAGGGPLGLSSARARARQLLAPVATTLAAMLGCAPLLLMNGATFPLLGVAANVIAAPVGELAALPFCLAHAVLSWAPSVERGCALVGSGALLVVRSIARASAETGAVLRLPEPSPAQLAALAATIALASVAARRAERLAALAAGAAAWLLLEVVAARAGAPRGWLRVHVLDVGQGDSILIDLPDGGAMLVDAGGFVGSPVDPGARVLQPLLRARRRARLDAVVLSHPHPDHFGGLPSAVAGVEVGELWDTGQGEAEGAGPVYAGLLSDLRRRGVPIVRPASLCGRPRLLSGATVEVLAPCPDLHPDVGANDNSFVLRITYGARSALLVGDAEHEAEAALVARYGAALRADLLKVGHHGSRTSTGPELLAAVDPSVAAISCGVRNRFGHPSPEVLARLAARGVAVARMDRGGALTWETDGERVLWSRPGAPPSPTPRRHLGAMTR